MEERKYKQLARMIAEESMVLLKNYENVLPLEKDKEIAFFGRTQLELLIGGNGSGAVTTGNITQIIDECGKAGLKPVPQLLEYYKNQLQMAKLDQWQQMQKLQGQYGFDFSNIKSLVNSGYMYEIFGTYQASAEEFAVSDELCHQAAESTDTALLVIGRNSGGEECDRHVDNDYYLTSQEKELAEKICRDFAHVIVVINANGVVDLSWTEEFNSLKAILFVGLPGEQGAAALADILTGSVSPSGKLAFTIAKAYEDYPSAKHFSWDKVNPQHLLEYKDYGLDAEENGSEGVEKSLVTVYQEDIYMGYRYFDTFKKEVQFPFGFGLSYASFSIETEKPYKENGEIIVPVSVKNISKFQGKEVVQIYLSPQGTATERPYQEFKDCRKTKMLKKGEEQKLKLALQMEELACYDEKTASYVIEAGTYVIRVGNSSRQTRVAGVLRVEQNLVTKKVRNRLVLQPCNQGKIDFLKQNDSMAIADNGLNVPGKEYLLITDNDITMKESSQRNYQKLSGMDVFSLEELAALSVGYGPGTPFALISGEGSPTIYNEEGSPVTTSSHPVGALGYVSPAIKEKGIDSIFYKDGPAGTGLTAWPTQMIMACSFDMELLHAFGDAAGAEAESQQVDCWLAPAVNLHRNPLGGRNFEYYSEDPVLTGLCGLHVALGVQENHSVSVCPKHFALNEQETYRRGKEKLKYDAVDSIVTERAARELYLKPFEIMVRGTKIRSIMTSFNKINGVFSAGNEELCKGILREEWGFDGIVVTDWGDMDYFVDGADAVHAGNDIVMPGGPPVIRQILSGYESGRVTREDLEQAVNHLLQFLRYHKRYQ